MAGKPSQEEHDVLLRRLVAEAEGIPATEVAEAHLKAFFAECARIATKGCGRRIRVEIAGNAMGIVAQVVFDPRRKGRYDEARNTFRSWCIAVLRNQAIDLARRSGHCWLESDAEKAPFAEAIGSKRNALGQLEIAEEIDRWSRDLRQVIDAIAWEPSGGSVDYFAAVLLQLRLGLWVSITRCDVSCDTTPAEAAEWLLPWHRHEEERALRRGLPAIGMVWIELAKRSDQPPNAEVLCETVNRLAGDPRALSAPVWRQWCHRARKESQRRISPAEWQEWFARWFPQRSSVDTA